MVSVTMLGMKPSGGKKPAEASTSLCPQCPLWLMPSGGKGFAQEILDFCEALCYNYVEIEIGTRLT
jgi:hypothetical protein